MTASAHGRTLDLVLDSTPLEYQAEEEIEGLTVYRYEQVIEPTDIGDLPEGAGSLFGVDDPDGVRIWFGQVR